MGAEQTTMFMPQAIVQNYIDDYVNSQKTMKNLKDLKVRWFMSLAMGKIKTVSKTLLRSGVRPRGMSSEIHSKDRAGRTTCPAKASQCIGHLSIVHLRITYSNPRGCASISTEGMVWQTTL